MARELESFAKQEEFVTSGFVYGDNVDQSKENTLGFVLEPVESLKTEELVSDGICASCSCVVVGCVTCILSW